MVVLGKIDWEEVKGVLKSPKFLVWSIVVVTLLVIAMILSTVYTKDQPTFIPEETREAVRGGIKENIAKPLKKVSSPVGEAVLRAEFKSSNSNQEDVESSLPKNGGADGSAEDSETKNWPTYRNEEYGFSIKYPEDLSLEEYVEKETEGDYQGTVSFWESPRNEQLLPNFDIDLFATSLGLSEWLQINGLSNDTIKITGESKFGAVTFTKCEEVGDPDHLAYFTKVGGKILKFKALLTDERVIENVLATFLYN